MTLTENLVRPSELYHMLIDNGIKKDNFREFVSGTEIVQNIEKAINFNLSDFILRLDNNDEIKNIVNISLKKGYERIGTYGEDILNILFINISSKALSHTKEIIDNYIRNQSTFTNFLKNDNNIDFDIVNGSFDKIKKKYIKYSKNPLKYFEYIEKKLNFIGNKMKKKLYKLYDMVEDKNKGDNTIFNWDLHTKINSKNENLLLKFNDFKDIKFDNKNKK